MPATPRHRSLSVLPLISAIFAVIWWSATPLAVGIISRRAGHSEIFTTASIFAIACGLALVARPSSGFASAAHHAPRALFRALGQCAISGVFLGVWYYAFYAALTSGPKVAVTVVAFTWPLIAVVAVAMLSPHHASTIRRRDATWMFVAFVAAAFVAASGNGAGGHASALWLAVAAAVGSGVYLPFALRGMDRLDAVLPSTSDVDTTIVAITTANIASLVTAGIFMSITGVHLDYSRFTPGTWIGCAVVGIGVYFVAEVAWTWAHARNTSKSLAALPHFTPAVSTLLLAIFLHEEVELTAIIGLLVVLATNVAIQFSKHDESSSTPSSSDNNTVSSGVIGS